MVAGTRDNPPPELPWVKHSTNRLHEDHQLVSGRRDNLGGGGGGGGGRVVSPRQVG